MDSISKSFSLFLIVLLAVSSLIMAKPAFAQTIPTPSVPEFTANFTHTIVYLTSDQLRDNYTIQVVIENQPYAYSNSGVTYQLYYDIRWKTLSQENWTDVYPTENLISNDVNYSYSQYVAFSAPQESESQYTADSFSFYNPLPAYFQQNFPNIPDNTHLDFQVEAIIGHNSTYYPHQYFEDHYPAIAFDVTSGWSNTQLLTVNYNSNSTSTTSPNPTISSALTSTPTPIVPEFPTWIILPLFAVMLLSIVFARKRNIRVIK